MMLVGDDVEKFVRYGTPLAAARYSVRMPEEASGVMHDGTAWLGGGLEEWPRISLVSVFPRGVRELVN